MEYSEVIRLIKRILKMKKMIYKKRGTQMTQKTGKRYDFFYYAKNKDHIFSLFSASSAFLFIAFLLLESCNNSAPKYTDTPTSGVVKIAVDETLAPILDSEISTFMALYKDAKVIAKYEPEADVFKDMLNDSASIGITARELNDNEKAAFKKQVIDPITTKIAIDAIAFIINNENTSGEITFPRIKEILSGKLKTWLDADDQNKLGEIKVVFDNMK